MSSEDRTPLPEFRKPATLRKRILTLRRGRERAVVEAQRAVATPPEWEDNEEPSYRVAHSEPGQRLSVEGPDAVEAAKALAHLRELNHPRKTVRESLAPVIEKMGSHKGKVAAIATGLVTVIGVIIEILRQLGVFKGGP